MKTTWIRLAADYGGVVNSGLCLLHCAAAPALLAYWGMSHESTAAQWEGGFLIVSGLLVGLATWRMSSTGLRLALWGFFGLFAIAQLLAARYPWLELVQYVASAGLIGMHLANRRYCRLTCP